MKRKTLILRFGAVAMTAAIGLMPSAVMAASSAAGNHNTSVANDLKQGDIIDSSRKGSLSIYKYDITAAEAAGDYKKGTYKATGESDSRVEEALSDYAIKGVQFSYMRVGDVETHSVNSETSSEIQLVYEIPKELAGILGLSASGAVDMSSGSQGEPCTRNDVYHYTSQQINDALAAMLEEADVAATNALENYLYDYGTAGSTTDEKLKNGAANMPKTDENGHTFADDLDLGLYLIVETEVPEQVTETVNPWFVQLPFTNTSSQTSSDGIHYDSSAAHDEDGVTDSMDDQGTDANVEGGEQWLYDMVCYPKDQTGNPTLDKSVRNAYSNTISSSEEPSGTDKNGTVHAGTDYVSANNSEALVVYNNDTNGENRADTDDAAYVANRGGYTADGITAGKNGAGYSTDYTYGDTTTASEGDVLDYILVSKLPHISSGATYLSEYTFVDTLSKGITYNKDVKIAFYHTEGDARANNTAKADLLWNLSDGNYTQEYASVSVTDPEEDSSRTDGSARLTVSLTEKGLAVINGEKADPAGDVNAGKGLSDYYMVVYYTASVNSDASVVLGDEGNPNHVQLIWSRTSDGYYNMLEDKNYVYTYGLDLTKTFSDHKGDFSNVQFKLYNGTDAYYVVAKQESDGVYYLTGKTTDEAKATSFVPDAKNGSLIINGMEADTYQLTEVATDDGYNLLKDQIVIDITATDRDIISSVAGVTGMDKDAVAAVVEHYNGGIYDENGNLVTSSLDELLNSSANYPKSETPQGRTIGSTDMYVGAVTKASSKVDGIDENMTEGNSAVVMSVNNTRGFRLPQTGGSGLYLITVLGVVTAAGGCYLVTRKKKIS